MHSRETHVHESGHYVKIKHNELELLANSSEYVDVKTL